jgi:hypothetical protein
MTRALKMIAVLAVGVCLAVGAAWAQEKPMTPAGQEKDKAAAADPVSGEWEGAVAMPEGAMPFSMKLKVEKDKVTGEIGGPQGATPITEGSFVDGKLTIAFTYVDGNGVVMSGAAAEGQLTGSLNYGSGQMVTTWSAKRKAPK